MKLWPWIVVIALVGLICTIPFGVVAQNEDEYTHSWDVYETVWLDYNYHNLTTISIKHPTNGSLVSNNQKLNFIIVPFDIEDFSYVIKVYKNNLLMYTITLERVYDVSIYTTEPINQIVTVTFTLNGIEILHLEYLAILTEPSLDRDFTDLWLQYQAERLNETLSGREHISARDQALREVNIVATTGFWALVLAGIAIFFVLSFQIISIFNAFSGIVWFGSVYLGIDGIAKLDAQMTSLEVVTPDDVYVYYAKMISMVLLISIANLFYLITYKATSTRLNKFEFDAIDKENRRIIKHHAVVGRQRGTGKPTWILQDSLSALRRKMFGADYVINYQGMGDLNDVYFEQNTKHIPENIPSSKPLRDMKRAYKAVERRKVMAQANEIFYAEKIPVIVNEDDLIG